MAPQTLPRPLSHSVPPSAAPARLAAQGLDGLLALRHHLVQLRRLRRKSACTRARARACAHACLCACACAYYLRTCDVYVFVCARVFVCMLEYLWCTNTDPGMWEPGMILTLACGGWGGTDPGLLGGDSQHTPTTMRRGKHAFVLARARARARVSGRCGARTCRRRRAGPTPATPSPAPPAPPARPAGPAAGRSWSRRPSAPPPSCS